jgi:hypothetical protein
MNSELRVELIAFHVYGKRAGAVHVFLFPSFSVGQHEIDYINFIYSSDVPRIMQPLARFEGKREAAFTYYLFTNLFSF